jgi:mRNA deadenylase 3'-5' endonuclease subunit Ccr4
LLYANIGLYKGKPQRHLQFEHRAPILLAQILAPDPDLLALQEVDAQYFTNYFQPELAYVSPFADVSIMLR